MSHKQRRDQRAMTNVPSRPQGEAHITTRPSASLPDAAAADRLIEGRITEGSRGRYLVETASSSYWCVLRGRLRKELTYPESASGRRGASHVRVREGDPVAIGDRVWLLPSGAREGVIERIAPREGGAVARVDPDAGRAGRPLTSVSGLDQVVIVFAAREPAPHPRLIDRFICLAEAQTLDVTLCVNKADQGIADWLAVRLAVYAAAGYSVVRTSAATGEGVEELRARLAGRASAFAGPSGVGKSSLLNALEPDLALRVAAVSAATGKGRHTTTGARLVALAGADGGWIADTAGIRALALEPATLANLDGTFREFRPYLGACAFTDCRHLSEPGCAVRVAVRAGSVDATRYDSYHRLLTGAPADLDGGARADGDGGFEDETRVR